MLQRLLRRFVVDREVQQYEALCLMLARPDLPCLPPRNKRYTQPGDAFRRDRLKRDLAAAYVRHRMLDAGEDAQIISVRRSPLYLAHRKRAPNPFMQMRSSRLGGCAARKRTVPFRTEIGDRC